MKRLLIVVFLLCWTMPHAQVMITITSSAPAGGFTCPTGADGVVVPTGYTAGNDAYILIDSAPGVNRFLSSTDYTVGAWVRFSDSGTSTKTIVSQWGNDTAGPTKDKQFALFIDQGEQAVVRQAWLESDQAEVQHLSTLSVDTWYFVVVTHDASEATEWSLWVYNSAGSEVGAEITGASNGDASQQIESVIGGAWTPDSDPVTAELDGEIAYMFYATGTNSVWTETEVANAASSGTNFCSEMEDLNTDGVLEWFYPLDGKDCSDSSDNAADCTFVEPGTPTITAYGGSGPFG